MGVSALFPAVLILNLKYILMFKYYCDTISPISYEHCIIIVGFFWVRLFTNTDMLEIVPNFRIAYGHHRAIFQGELCIQIYWMTTMLQVTFTPRRIVYLSRNWIPAFLRIKQYKDAQKMFPDELFD